MRGHEDAEEEIDHVAMPKLNDKIVQVRARQRTTPQQAQDIWIILLHIEIGIVSSNVEHLPDIPSRQHIRPDIPGHRVSHKDCFLTLGGGGGGGGRGVLGKAQLSWN